MKKFYLLFILGIFVLSSQTIQAQTTISNIPATDVLDPQTYYIEANFGGHFGKYADGGFQSYGLKALYGLRRNVEIGANFTYTKDGSISPVEVSPNIKWKAYNNEKYAVSVSGGAVAFIPVRDEKGARPTAMIYANASKNFDAAKGFRLTGGVYSIIGAKSVSGNRKGVMLGYEQTLIKKSSLFVDWTSGNNRFGYTAAGLSIPLSKKDVFYAGYNFGNTGRGNNWLSVSYGRFF